MTVQDYFTTDELIYSERMCVADRNEGPTMASSNINDSDTELLGRVLAGKKHLKQFDLVFFMCNANERGSFAKWILNLRFLFLRRKAIVDEFEIGSIQTRIEPCVCVCVYIESRGGERGAAWVTGNEGSERPGPMPRRPRFNPLASPASLCQLSFLHLTF